MLSVTVTGRLAGDPRVNAVKGNDVANFTILSNSRKGSEDVTTAVDVAVWGKRSETVAKYFKKGSMVTVTGTGHIETFERSNGELGAKLSIQGADFTLPPKPASDDF